MISLHVTRWLVLKDELMTMNVYNKSGQASTETLFVYVNRHTTLCWNGSSYLMSLHCSYNLCCCPGGMAEKWRTAEFHDWWQHRHPSGPQPHYQRGASVRLRQLHLFGQQHCGKETQCHSHCDSIWYGSYFLSYNCIYIMHVYCHILCIDTMFTCLFKSLCWLPAPYYAWLRDLSPCFCSGAMFPLYLGECIIQRLN